MFTPRRKSESPLVPHVQPRAGTEPPPKLLNAIQLKRLLVRERCECFYVQQSQIEASDAEQHKYLDKMKDLADEFADVFQDPPPDLPPQRDVGHSIPLEPCVIPPYRPQCKLSHLEYKEAKRQLQEYLAKGWINPSSSPFRAPIIVVPKKNGKLRMCVDYRALNKLTVKIKTRCLGLKTCLTSYVMRRSWTP